jgi:hypothetical protein
MNCLQYGKQPNGPTLSVKDSVVQPKSERLGSGFLKFCNFTHKRRVLVGAFF